MKNISALELFEKEAEAFYKATGIMAPGKDEPLGWGGASDEERQQKWTEWHKTHCLASQKPI